MRGVDLSRFDFDYDLTWAGFFLDSQGAVIGRFGGRDTADADAHLSLKALKYAMRRALERNADSLLRDDPAADERTSQPASAEPSRVEDYPAARRVQNNDCIHCHQVYDFRRDLARQNKSWNKGRDIWVYPSPDNLGLSIDRDRGDLLSKVAAGSAAAEAGLKAGDSLTLVGGLPIAAFADLQYALHRAPWEGRLEVVYQRGGDERRAEIRLMADWKKTDISWRGSMWSIPPTASVYGDDLTVESKKKLGLGPKRLAFYMGDYVPPPAASAGIRKRDVIVGIDGQELEMNMLQFNVYVRVNYEVGDKITYNIIRDGKKMNLPTVLQEREQ